MADVLSTLVFIILSVLSCPVIILMNVLVITVIKTTPTLQIMYNILLTCLAATDLLVAMETVRLPTVIAAEIFAIAGGSGVTYCTIKNNIAASFLNISILASLLHLVVISVERYMAMKFVLR